MVRRFSSIALILIIVSALISPVLAADEFGYPIDTFGVGLVDSDKITLMTDNNNVISGSMFSGLTSGDSYTANCYNIYIPAPVKYDTIYLTFTSQAKLGFDGVSVDWGILHSSGYVQSGTCSYSRLQLLYRRENGIGLNTFEYKIDIPSDFVPSTSTVIRIVQPPPDQPFLLKTEISGQEFSGEIASVADPLSGTIDLSNVIMKSTGVSLSGTVMGDLSIAKNGLSITGTVPSVYFNGRLRTDSSTTYNLSTSYTTTAAYLQLPSHSIALSNTSKAIQGDIETDATLSGDTGSIAPTTGHKTATIGGTNHLPSRSLSGTLSDGTEYLDVMTFKAVGVSDDSDLITTINTGFNRNHNDLLAISGQLEQLVDHQEAVDTAGSQIGGTTTESTISSTSGDLSSGVDGLDSSISTVTDISSLVAGASQYVNLLGFGMNIMFNWGDGLLLWAVLAIIVCTVILYLIRRISE